MAHLAIRSRELFLVAILWGDEETYDTRLFSSILALLAFCRGNAVIVLHYTGIADLNGYATQIVFHTFEKTGRLAGPKVSVIPRSTSRYLFAGWQACLFGLTCSQSKMKIWKCTANLTSSRI